MKTKALFSLCLMIFMQCGYTQNHALSFDGSNDFANLGAEAATDIRSIELWFKPANNILPTNNERQALLMRNTETGDGEFGIYFGKDFQDEQGRLTFTRKMDDAYYYVYSDRDTWHGGKWHHVVAVVDSIQGMLLYIDGELQLSSEAIYSKIESRTEETMLACWGDKYIRWFDGKIDEVRFWKRALSLEEIMQNMCDTIELNQAVDLWGYWPMNQISDTAIYNYGEGGVDGFIEGAVYQQDTLCSSVSIDEATSIQNIAIFPNPIYDKGIIRFPDNKTFTGTLFILDQTGRIIEKQQFSNVRFLEIIKGNNAPGTYYYFITSDNLKFQGKIMFL